VSDDLSGENWSYCAHGDGGEDWRKGSEDAPSLPLLMLMLMLPWEELAGEMKDRRIYGRKEGIWKLLAS
jgi:hypothetical protein